MIELPGPVAGFSVTKEHIDCICARELIKLDRASGEVVQRKAIFEKDGLSRRLTAYGGQLFLYDFCSFYIFQREDYRPVGRWQLGLDLSSDICGMAVDDSTVYCSIRNGGLTAIDRRSHAVTECHVSDSSMWSVKAAGSHLLCGTVDGRLLQLQKPGLIIERELALGKKNIASLYIHGGTLYAAGQDGRLSKIDLSGFRVERLVKKAHRKMFRCIGMYRGMLLTVSYPCSEIALWDGETLGKLGVLEIPLSLSGCAHLDGGLLYIASRNISGIDVIDINSSIHSMGLDRAD